MASPLGLDQENIPDDLGWDSPVASLGLADSGTGLGLTDLPPPPPMAPGPDELAPKPKSRYSEHNPLSSATGMTKAGYMIEALGAGIGGRTPLHLLQEDRNLKAAGIEQEKKQQQLAAFKATYGMFDESFKVLQRVPPEKRQQAITTLAKQMDSVSPGAGLAFTHYAQFGDPDLEKGMMMLFKDPDTVKALMRVTGGNEEKFYKLITSKDFMENIHEQIDAKNVPTATQKLARISAMAKAAFPEEVRARIKTDKDGKMFLDAATLQSINSSLPDDTRLTPSELRAVDRKPEKFVGAGYISPKASEEIQKKALTKEQWGEPYNLNGNLVQKNKDTGEIRSVDKSSKTHVTVDQRDNRTFDQESSLRGEFEKVSKKFVNLRDYFVPVARFMEKEGKEGKKPSSSTDLQLVYAYLQTLDPKDDRVSEGDFRRLKQLGSIPEKLGTAISSVFTGYNLPDDVRREMYATVGRAFKEQNKSQRAHEERYASIAAEHPGLSPQRVVKQYSVNEKGGSGLAFPSTKEQPGVPSVDEIVSKAKENKWTDDVLEKTLRDMHGEAGVRHWKEKRRPAARN